MATKLKTNIDAKARRIPIPPLSVVRLARRHGEHKFWKRNRGRIFRVGYYSRQDGLDCIWLVNEDGKYEQATDHEFLYRYFDIIHFADHQNWYGRGRPKIPPIRRADGGRTRKTVSEI